MAWSWSHSQEAYANARVNLELLDSDDLCVILAEWKAVVDSGEPESLGDEFDSDLYETELARLWEEKDRLGESFAEYYVNEIWDHAEAQATCDNGGFNAWVCPFGCHTVSFSIPGEPEYDR